MIGEKELYVIFDPTFLEDIEELGNSIVISEYYIEDVRADIVSLSDILDEGDYIYYRKNNTLSGLWDSENKTLKVHLSLSSDVFSNKPREDIFEIESINQVTQTNDGSGLVRLFRFKYVRPGETDLRTAFIITGKTDRKLGKLIVEPIKCNQDKILINVIFPDTAKANISAAKIERDTKLLEGYGVLRGDNILRDQSEKTLASRKTSHYYLEYTTTEIKIQKKDVPYISNSGAGIYRRDSVRVYTGVRIYCSGILKNIQPNTRPKLSKNGGLLRIYGDLEYEDYEVRGSEFIYTGKGTESIDGVPDTKLIVTEHVDGLKDVSIFDKFYIKYGKYEEQPDPSVLVKVGINFYNPFKQEVDYLESKNIKLTQEEEVYSQWEIIYRSTTYTEPTGDTEIPVYLFPWKSGYTHYFIVRTSLPNLNIEQDFYLDPILSTYYDIQIERIGNRTYPLVDYKVSITSKLDNLDPVKWYPIVDGESRVLLSTLILRNYEYSESFYFIQSPKAQEIELHNQDNNNIQEIVLEHNQTEARYYPVAPETTNLDDIGDRNTWKILDTDDRIIPVEDSGLINPNNPQFLENYVNLKIPTQPVGIENLDLGKIVLGRIKESEQNYNFSGSDWRNVVSLGSVSVPVIKRGLIENIESEESIILKEINLYKIKVTCNGPFACWMEESQDYCFFNPQTNLPTYTNYFYSREFNSTDGVYIYVALHNTIVRNEEPIEENKILFSVVNREPDWSLGRPDCFDDTENLAECIVYRKAPDFPEVSYVNPKDMYVFLDPFTETYFRLRSTETPILDRLQIINNDADRFRQPATLVNSLEPIYTTQDNYKYHRQGILDSNDVSGYYPVSPSFTCTAHSYNYPESSCMFWIFRRALGPYFYRVDSVSSGNTIYVAANPNNTQGENRKTLVINSRYKINNSDITRELEIENGFTIESIVYTDLGTSDCRHQYTITLGISLENTGYQRTLGILVIKSRITNLINLTSLSTSSDSLYTNLTQNEIDEIVPPGVMKISIIQAGINGNNSDEIRVFGDRNPEISSAGETRVFRIFHEIPIQTPEITNLVGCTVSGITTEEFTLIVPPVSSSYDPATYSNEPTIISFDLLINPEDTSSNQSYSESFTFKQLGYEDGLMYANTGEAPRLYLGNTEIIENVSYNTTELNIFLGAFGVSSDIQDGSRGLVGGIKITSDNNYSIISDSAVYYDKNWSPTIKLRFPENTSNMMIDRVFILTYKENKITLVIKQSSAGGNIYCSDNAYFLSHGECIETVEYRNDMGFFTFHTDINIRELSLGIPASLLESYSFIYIGPSTEYGGSYSKYKAQIKLKPNLSSSIIRKQIFSFIRDGRSIRNVYINQGFYCLIMYYPGSSTHGITSGGELGSTKIPIEVPSKNNIISGTTEKVFNLSLKRCEFSPVNGLVTEETINILDDRIIVFPRISLYTWTFPGHKQTNKDSIDSSRNIGLSTSGEIYKDPTTPTITIGDILLNYSTELSGGTDLSSIPSLENIYTVNSNYYNSDVLIKVEVKIKVDYPLLDPLYIFGKSTEHSYTIYLKKIKDDE